MWLPEMAAFFSSYNLTQAELWSRPNVADRKGKNRNVNRTVCFQESGGQQKTFPGEVFLHSATDNPFLADPDVGLSN